MVDDSDDYELMPRAEVEQLRKELAAIKKNPLGEGAKGKELLDSVDRLNSSINKLISILEDAQQDIIDEYQESKPVEKLNNLLDQNETIARALISINDKLSGKKESLDMGAAPKQAMPPIFDQPKQPVQQLIQQPLQPQPMQPRFDMMPQQPIPQPAQQQPVPNPMNQPAMPGQFNAGFSQPQFQAPQQQFNLPPDLPPLDSLPPLDMPPQDPNMLPEHRKKKFLGLM